jgi:serine/threonine-protein kinase
VTRRADPNTWRDRVRDPLAWRDQSALVELARVAPVAGQPVHLLVALGERLQATGGNGTEFLARVQQEHRRDFWANFTLGTVHLEKGQMDEALRLYRETGTIWPRVAALDNNLGLVWYSKYYLPGAMECYQNAVRKNPTFAPVHNNFGLALKAKGQLDDAIDHYREALSLDPELALAHSNLGEVLAGKGQLDNAMGHYRASLRIDPEYARCHYLLGVALTGKGRLDEANDRFQEALRIDPADARAHDKIFGFALDEGIEHHKRCDWLDPRFTVSHNNLGLTERDMGRLNEAIGHYERALQLEPALHKARAALGQALLALGRFSEAQAATHSCLERLPRGKELHTNLLAQLQRCERLLALQDRLPAVLQGKDRPADAAEAEQFAELCGMKSQIVAAARLYSDAFAASPRSAEELHSDHRYTAACAAALAGCGRGQDHAALSEAELAHWRERAREWLRAELAVWSQGLDNGPEADRLLVRQKLAHLWSDPDLAGLFERDALNKLPSAERQECRTLWADIDTLIRRAQTLK